MKIIKTENSILITGELIMRKWIHKHEVEEILDLNELNLMNLVSEGVLTGFDQNYSKVKHYGKWHIDQKEDERLPLNILSNRVFYFDHGDVINCKKKNAFYRKFPQAPEPIKPLSGLGPMKKPTSSYEEG